MLLNLVAYLLIPLYTILFAENSNWFTTNFSVLGNLSGRKIAFIVWGLLVGIYYFYCLRHIVAHMEKQPRGTWLIPLSLVLLSCAITTPYLPEMLPLKSFLHIVFAFLAAVCLMCCLYLIVWRLCKLDIHQYRRYLILLVCITLVSGALLWLVGIVSSALEIFFTVATELLVHRLYTRLTQPSPS